MKCRNRKTVNEVLNHCQQTERAQQMVEADGSCAQRLLRNMSVMRQRKIKCLSGNECRQGHHGWCGNPTGRSFRSPAGTHKRIKDTDHDRCWYAEKQNAQEYEKVARGKTGPCVGNADRI